MPRQTAVSLLFALGVLGGLSSVANAGSLVLVRRDAAPAEMLTKAEKLNAVPLAVEGVPSAGEAEAKAEKDYQNGLRLIAEMKAGALVSDEDVLRMTRKLDAEHEAALAKARAAYAKTAAVKPADSVGMEEDAPTKPAAPVGWQITKNDHSLKALLSRWAQQSGWNLVWDYTAEVTIDTAETTLDGTLEGAINQVLGSLQHTESPLMATLYEGNKTIRVSAKD